MESKMNNHNSKLDITTLESWLWEAACKIRGDIDAPKYKDYILPLIFLKRLSDVFEDEVSKLTESYGDSELTEQLIGEDHGLKTPFSQILQLYQGDGHQLAEPGMAIRYHLHPHPDSRKCLSESINHRSRDLGRLQPSEQQDF